MTQYHPSLAEAVHLALPRYSVPLFGPLAPFGRYFDRDALLVPTNAYLKRVLDDYRARIRAAAAQAAP